MSYCEVEDVQKEFKSIAFDETNSAVVTDSVQEFIDQASAEMDAKLSVRYIVPVTASDSALLYLKQICIWLVSQRVKDICEIKNVRVESDQDVKVDTAARARKMLNEIVQGDVPLIGATETSSASGVQSFVSSSGFQRTWRRGEDQW